MLVPVTAKVPVSFGLEDGAVTSRPVEAVDASVPTLFPSFVNFRLLTDSVATFSLTPLMAATGSCLGGRTGSEGRGAASDDADDRAEDD